jgi:hypothetical protein
MITKGEWRTEAISDCVRVVVGKGRAKIILARCAPKQLPEAETTCNAKLMALAPQLANAFVAVVNSGLIGGADHPIGMCGCSNCALRRLAWNTELLIS